MTNTTNQQAIAMRTSRLSLFVLFAIMSSTVFAQKSVQEWADMEDKKFTKKMLEGSGLYLLKKFVESDDQVPQLKRVGILGLSIIQPTYDDKQPYSIITPYLTDAGTVFFAERLYKSSIAAMKADFQASGVELLESAEYLDTDAKRKKFKETEFEMSDMWKAVASMANRLRGGRVDDVMGNLPGTKFIIGTIADAKVWRAIAAFTKEMELDAMLVIETTLLFDGKITSLDKIEAALVGPNPIPYSEKDKKNYAPVGPVKGYLEGVIYGSLAGHTPGGPISLAQSKKGEIKEQYFTGIDKVYEKVGRLLLAHTRKELEGLKKKK